MSVSTTPTVEEVLARNYTFIAKADQEDGGWVIMYPDLPGVITQADTWDEIGEMAHDALRAWVEVQLEDDRPIPEPTEFEVPTWNWESVGVSLLSTKEVAKRLNVTPRRVLALAADRGVGQRFGRSVMFHPDDVERLRPNSVGRPRKYA